MPDFDVAAVALAAPANPSQLGTYRPVITVRNNGVGPATATGTVSAYMAGLLVFHSAVQSGVLDPGKTGPATSLDPWIITEEGTYTLMGYVTCDQDQVEPNNNLAPATVVISGHAPPPPQPVTAHAPQHEFNGTDQLDVSGLHGELASPQTAVEHAPTHETGGADALDVSDLPGQLAEPQTPTAHGNEHHTQPFETATGVAASIAVHDHAATAHETNTVLERTTHKDQDNGYAGLDGDGLVANAALAGNPIASSLDYLAADRTWKPIKRMAVSAITDSLDIRTQGATAVLDYSGPSLPAGTVFKCAFEAVVYTTTENNITVRLLAGVSTGDLEPIASAVFPIAAAASGKIRCDFESQKLSLYMRGNGVAHHDLPAGVAVPIFPTTTYKYVEDSTCLRLSVEITLPSAGTRVIVYNAEMCRIDPA